MFKNLTLSTAAAACAIAACIAIAPKAQAQEAVFLTDQAGHCEIFRAISRVIPGECAPGYEANKMLTRSLVRRDTPEPEPMPIVQADVPAELSAALVVNFELNSSHLTSESRNALDSIAAVIGDELMSHTKIQVEGHADVSGSDSYNLTLSEKRARTVRDYLVEHHGISPERLSSVGKGESDLYDRLNPYSGQNRRVEFVNING